MNHYVYTDCSSIQSLCKEDTVIGGKYPIKKGEDRISVLIPQLHRDKDAWGDNVEEFQPERFEELDKVPHHAYKPFGN